MRAERRLLIYSHDSFGLGHLRRCRTIAHDLVGRFGNLSVLILSGSPIIGSFDFKSRVDFVRVPGVIKLRNGEYTALNLHIDIDRTVAIRSSIIQHTADVFEPDLFIVDKEPLGLRGEVKQTLELLRAKGTRCVLGLRDVMDEPQVLLEEWERKGVFPALRDLYHDIWVYGLPEIFDPVAEVPGFAEVAAKVHYTGYLRREVPASVVPTSTNDLPEGPFILVTTGGGGDGEDLVDWIVNAYEQVSDLAINAVIVLGPFMPPDLRATFQARIEKIPSLRAIVFESNMELLFDRASAIVGMGGYNTFCEILSFGKPAIIVPRTVPRLEQYLRAERAQQLGLVHMLPYEDDRDPGRMASMLQMIIGAAPPDPVLVARMLEGLERIATLAAPWLDASLPEAANG
ncbi:Predicted glycosyl transferase [Arboricoccus pini]|uniref:Predicted glycosyl transferase n=1 Tax=Arboricoccus pini TaxID=1963835 RepID=A0A212Q157_9PROT|nr:glycosyltransferase [Arboricoccus pini]SNB53091.1 Predicted glycosyl transferase [Arboricoccus pini]